MSPDPIYEFLLWNTCKNNCKFCHQKANKARFPGKFPDDEGKYKSIKLVEHYIKNGNCIDGSNILLMGGELFDTKLSEKTEYAFLQLIDTIVNRMYNQQTFLFYMNSNLIYEDLNLLYKVLERFNLNIIGRNRSQNLGISDQKRPNAFSRNRPRVRYIRGCNSSTRKKAGRVGSDSRFAPRGQPEDVGL